MRKFLSRLKCNVPWPLFMGGAVLLVVGLLLKDQAIVFISGLFGLGTIVVFGSGCVLDVQLEMISKRTRMTKHNASFDIDPTGTPLTPSFHGQDCLAHGEHPGIECCCDECDHYLTCFPDWFPGAIWDETTQRFI